MAGFGSLGSRGAVRAGYTIKNRGMPGTPRSRNSATIFQVALCARFSARLVSSVTKPVSVRCAVCQFFGRAEQIGTGPLLFLVSQMFDFVKIVPPYACSSAFYY